MTLFHHRGPETPLSFSMNRRLRGRKNAAATRRAPTCERAENANLPSEPRSPDRRKAGRRNRLENVQRKLRTRIPAFVSSSLPRSLKCAIRSPDLASASGASSRWRSDLLLLRPLHGYWDSPELSSGSLNAGPKPERCVFQTRKHTRFICTHILCPLCPLVNRFFQTPTALRRKKPPRFSSAAAP